MSELTDEQKQFLAECEAEFANRYTDADKDFVQVSQTLYCSQYLNKTFRSNKLE